MTIKILIATITLYIETVISGDQRPFFSDGEWRTYPGDLVAKPGPCNIDIKDATMTYQQFMTNYAKTRPFIVRDAANNDIFRALARK